VNSLDPLVKAFAPQAGDDIGDAITPRVHQGASVTSLAFYSFSAVRAECRLSEIVRHWRRDESELCLFSAGFFIGTMGVANLWLATSMASSCLLYFEDRAPRKQALRFRTPPRPPEQIGIAEQTNARHSRMPSPFGCPT
jgi:hypothetical protein